MTILITTVVVAGLLFAALFALYRWGRPKSVADTPPAQQARATEAKADAAAEAQHAAEVKASEERLLAEVERARQEREAAARVRPVDMFNQVAREAEEREKAKAGISATARKVGPLVLALMLLPHPARALEPCTEDAVGVVCCPKATAELMAREVADLKLDLATARAELQREREDRAADARQAEAELAAAHARIAALEAAPASEKPVPWGWVGAGVAAGAVGVIAIVIAAR